MANKKRKKAKQKAVVEAAAAEQRSLDTEVEPEKKKTSDSKASSDAKNTGKSKGKEKEVVKAQARAKDTKKANKKPNIFRRFIEYIKQVRLEIKRTTWPTRNEVLNMTIIVLVALIFFGLLIFILDFIMVQLLQLYGQFAPDAATYDPTALGDAGTGDTGAAADGAADTGAADGADTGDTPADGGE